MSHGQLTDVSSSFSSITSFYKTITKKLEKKMRQKTTKQSQQLPKLKQNKINKNKKV